MKSSLRHINGVCDALRAQQQNELVFEFNEQTIRPGYHVTEIKHGRISSLDCGSGTHQWNEVVIALLDGPVSRSNNREGYMTGTKFLQIVDTAMKTLPEQNGEQLLFEFNGSNGVVQRFQITEIKAGQTQTHILLAGEQVVCKPAQRMNNSLSAQSNAETCCGSSTSQETAVNRCCGEPAKANACCG